MCCYDARRLYYECEVYTRKDVDMLWKHLLRYHDWALAMIAD